MFIFMVRKPEGMPGQIRISKTRELDPKFHKYLIAAQDYRSQGDYSYGPSVPEEHVQNAIKWAEEFLEVARNYMGENKHPLTGFKR